MLTVHKNKYTTYHSRDTNDCGQVVYDSVQYPVDDDSYAREKGSYGKSNHNLVRMMRLEHRADLAEARGNEKVLEKLVDMALAVKASEV